MPPLNLFPKKNQPSDVKQEPEAIPVEEITEEVDITALDDNAIEVLSKVDVSRLKLHPKVLERIERVRQGKKANIPAPKSYYELTDEEKGVFRNTIQSFKSDIPETASAVPDSAKDEMEAAKEYMRSLVKKIPLELAGGIKGDVVVEEDQPQSPEIKIINKESPVSPDTEEKPETNVTAPKDPVITAEEKRRFISALMSGNRYEENLSLLGGAIEVTLIAPTMQEKELFSLIVGEIQELDYNPTIIESLYIKASIAFTVLEIAVGDKKITLARPDNFIDPQNLSASLQAVISQANMVEDALPIANISETIFFEIGQFLRKVSYMASKAASPDFWKEIP